MIKGVEHRKRDKINFQFFIIFAFIAGINAQTSSLDSMVDTLAGRQEMEFLESVEEQALGDTQTLRQFIKDSLQLVYEEAFMEQKDSIATLFNNQITDILNQNSLETNRLEKTIRALRDSLKISKKPAPAPMVTQKTEYDPISEEKYFSYEKLLKQQETKSKSGFLILSSTVEDIYTFQVNELERYINRFFPEARCDSVQDYLTQMYIRKGDWAKAELSIIKFIFLYPQSPLYEEIKTIRSGIFTTEKTYKSNADFLMNIVSTTPEYPSIETRYFKLLELLKDFPDPAVKPMFVKEAQKYLELYPFSEQSAKVCLWLAEYFANNQRAQSAFITYHRLMIFYPDSPEMILALYRSARIQEKEFEEFDPAIETYYRFIEQFPDDTLAISAHHHIAKIADAKQQNWERAISEYQISADLYLAAGKTDLSTEALMRKAVILADQMNLIQDAVTTYLSIDERFPGTEGAHIAIAAAGDLFKRHKQFESAIAQYMSLYEKYPDAANVLDALDKTADIYNSELGNADKTVETLNLIITNYPDSKSAGKAEKLLKKLQKVK
ncbi:MAG: tetratricopeptide repeat protein [Candidatus Marinimicrobia bacterium]|nr:tetratricopeptide repeat protein [Candidatus Neomarinimicrobiota bacterium]